MTKNTPRIFISLLLMLLCIGILPVSAFASSGDYPDDTLPAAESSAADAQKAKQIGTVTTNGGNLNVRTGAGLDNTAFTQLPNGTVVDVIGRDGDWVKILLPARAGYVYGSYLTVTNAEYDTGSNGEITLPFDEKELADLWQQLLGGMTGSSGALTPDGNLTSIDDILQSAASVSTEDSLENKQFITVQSKSGNTFYIVIDRSGDTENVYFLNLVDEADLMALMGDDAEQADTTCICQTHCEVGAINTDCPVCKASMPDCMGKAQTVQKDPEPVTDSKPEATADTKADSAQEKSNAPLILLLLVLLGGGFALYWFKLRKPKPDTKGSADLDDYDFGEEDDADEPEETVDEDEPV